MHNTVQPYLGEERVETVHLLSFFDIRIELCDALERELVHEVDFIGLNKVFVLKKGDAYVMT